MPSVIINLKKKKKKKKSYFEKGCLKTCACDNPEKVAWDMIKYTVPDTVAVELTLVALRLKNSQTYVCGLSNFFKEQSDPKITHNTFRDFRVHFFRKGLSRNSCIIV